jgi:hypothetical protein
MGCLQSKCCRDEEVYSQRTRRQQNTNEDIVPWDSLDWQGNLRSVPVDDLTAAFASQATPSDWIGSIRRPCAQTTVSTGSIRSQKPCLSKPLEGEVDVNDSSQRNVCSVWHTDEGAFPDITELPGYFNSSRGYVDSPYPSPTSSLSDQSNLWGHLLRTTIPPPLQCHSKSHLQCLMQKALAYRGRRHLNIEFFYRDREYSYFCEARQSGWLKTVLKDTNGDPLSAIRNRLKVLHFQVNVDFRTHQPCSTSI